MNLPITLSFIILFIVLARRKSTLHLYSPPSFPLTGLIFRYETGKVMLKTPLDPKISGAEKCFALSNGTVRASTE